MNPGSFVLVGIGGFFAGVAKTPISAIIMACEMSASYTLLVPLMLVSTTSYLLLRNTSLYEKQQISRIASPAHLTEFARGMLEKIRVHEAINERPITRIPEDMPFGELVKTVTRWTVGIGMILHGEVGLIFARIGASLVFEGEKVIGATTYSAVVIMVIVTTLVTPPLLKWTLTNGKAPPGEGEA